MPTEVSFSKLLMKSTSYSVLGFKGGVVGGGEGQGRQWGFGGNGVRGRGVGHQHSRGATHGGHSVSIGPSYTHFFDEVKLIRCWVLGG